MIATNLMVAAADGDLVGNWSWTVWLLIPMFIVLGLITARCLGPAGDPERARSGGRGVTRALARRAADAAPVQEIQ